MNSVFKNANKNKIIKDMMEECYYELSNKHKETEFISTNVVNVNLLLSGKVNGGIPIGKLSMISAPSMLGKSFIAMSIIKNAQKKGMSILVIDTERSFSIDMAISLGVDISKNKLFVFRDNSIETIKTFITNYFDGITLEEKENTLVVIDSWGTLITSKTIKDGMTGNDVADMTEARKKNNLANIILNTKATYFIINHVYDNIGGFGDLLSIPGGRRIIFNCDCVLLGMSRSKSKSKDIELKKDVVDGHIITARTHKSRYCKEMTTLKFKIKHDGGLDPYYGILEDAISGGFVSLSNDSKSKKYIRPHIKNDPEIKEKDMYTTEFWKPVFQETNFKDYLEKKYRFEIETDMLKHETDLDEIFG